MYDVVDASKQDDYLHKYRIYYYYYLTAFYFFLSPIPGGGGGGGGTLISSYIRRLGSFLLG